MTDGEKPSEPPQPTAEMIEALYGTLRELARARMRRERPDATPRHLSSSRVAR